MGKRFIAGKLTGSRA